jgi:hypothetical protein
MAATNGRPMKAKGARFEREVVACLRGHGHPYAERAYGAGRPRDIGDIDGLPGFALECKAHRSIDLASFMDEAATEAENAGGGIVPVVIAKRRGKPTADAYVVMRLGDWAQLVSEASL